MQDLIKGLFAINGGGKKMTAGAVTRVILMLATILAAYWGLSVKVERCEHQIKATREEVAAYHEDAWTHTDDELYMERYSESNNLKFPAHPEGRIARKMAQP